MGLIRKQSRDIGTSLVSIGSYTVGASKTATAIGWAISNKSTTETISLDVSHHDGSNENYILKGVALLPNSSLCPLAIIGKVVMEAGDSIKVKSSVAASADCSIYWSEDDV